MAKKGILRTAQDSVMFWCPGCDGAHAVRISGAGPCWSFNNDYDNPTFNPSVLVTGTMPMTDQQHDEWMNGKHLPIPQPLVCHSFVNDGQIQFLTDCTHQLAGQTVAIPDFDI